MSRPARAGDARSGSLGTLAIFLFGVPLGAAALVFIQYGPIEHALLRRYVSHPVEHAEVILFTCALCALAGKLLSYLRERAACSRDVLSATEGGPQPAAEVLRRCRHDLDMQPRWVRSTFLSRRIAGLLDYVAGRGSAAGLDDQLRALSDTDAMTLEGSYALLRFINWAIPILGFLGTVLGITDAISGVTPEMLERSLSTVTDGLATAFDTTALALLLTMILMFGCFVLEKLEQGVLEAVDAYADAELAPRFPRAAAGGEAGPLLEALHQQAQVILAATQQLVEKQAALWAGTVQKAEHHWTEAGGQQQQLLAAAVSQAVEQALTRAAERAASLETQLLQRNGALLEALQQTGATMKQTSREHQLALARLTDQVGLQVQALAQVQADEGQLVRLQETLSRNLALLAGADTFEQTLQSLTAAIHLLTTRAGGPPTPRLHQRPDAA